MTRYLSKSIATWLAILGGSLGLHRFYLYGAKDIWGWLHPIPAAMGVYGLWRVQEFGLDDQASWVLIPLLGLVVAQAMLMAIIYALTPDEKWDAQRNPGARVHATRWTPVIGAAIALALGAGVLMATVVIMAQRYFEYQVDEAAKMSQ